MAGLVPAIRSGTSPRQIADGLLAVTHGSQSFRRQVSDRHLQHIQTAGEPIDRIHKTVLIDVHIVDLRRADA